MNLNYSIQQISGSAKLIEILQALICIKQTFQKIDLQQSPFKESKPFLGTTRYASVAAHKGHEIGRKDDLESLGFMLIFLLKGSLPWSQIQSQNDQDKLKQVGQMKITIDINQLCQEIPVEFARYMDYVKKLSFKQQPDYKYLQQLFKRLAQNQNFLTPDRKFDWTENLQTTKSQSSDTQFLKRQNRRQSGEAQKIVQHNVMSITGNTPNSKQSSNQKDFFSKPQFGSSQQDSELGSSNVIPSSYLKIPEKGYGQSQLSLERNPQRHKSVSTYLNDSYSEIQSVDQSILVGFQPSMISCNIQIGSFQKVISQNQNQIGLDAYSPINSSYLQQHHHSFNGHKQQLVQSALKQNLLNFEEPKMSPSASAHKNSLIPLDFSQNFSREMSIKTELQLNENDQSDLSNKYELLIQTSVNLQFLNYKNSFKEFKKKKQRNLSKSVK